MGILAGTFFGNKSTPPIIIPSFRSGNSSSAGSGGGTSITTTTLPSGVANGDLLITWFAVTTSLSSAPAPLPGWTQQGGTSYMLYIYTKIASSEPSTYNWSITRATYTNVASGILAYKNVTTGVDSIGAIGANTSSTTLSAPSDTATQRGKLLFLSAVWYSTTSDPNITITSPVGFTYQYGTINFSLGTINIYLADQSNLTTGATGIVSAMASNNVVYEARLMQIY